MRYKVIIDGNNFDDIMGFYDEVERVLTKDLTWRIGRNLDAFNDVLRGGFGIHEYGEFLDIKWINFSKSKDDFGYPATIEHYERMLKRCHPTAIPQVTEKLNAARKNTGPTLMDIIVDIIVKDRDSGHYCTLETDGPITLGDWRLLNDVKHLSNKYVNPTDGEEITKHMKGKQDCIFCWEPVLNNWHERWYVAEPDHYCICEECFQDFKEMFGFRLLDGWDLEWGG